MVLSIRYDSYRKTAKAIGLNAGMMHKDIIATIVGSDKAKALFGIKPFYRSRLRRKGSTQATRSCCCRCCLQQARGKKSKRHDRVQKER